MKETLLNKTEKETKEAIYQEAIYNLVSWNNKNKSLDFFETSFILSLVFFKDKEGVMDDLIKEKQRQR